MQFKIGFNLLLFVVLLILFVGYCWTIVIEKDYNKKIEKFAASIDDLNPGLSTPSQELKNNPNRNLPFCSTSKSDYVCDENNENNKNNNSYDPGTVPSVAQNSTEWRHNNLNIEAFPESDLLKLYIPTKHTFKLYMGGSEELLTVGKNDIYDSKKSPLDPNGNKIVAQNDELIYTNSGNKPWEHHDVQRSLPIDPKVKFTNAYYYEFDNVIYLKNIKTALIVPCELLADAVLTSNWSESIDPSIENKLTNQITDAYNNCLNYINTQINNAESMILPSDIKLTVRSKIQIVHDIFKEYKIHNTGSSMYLINMQLILYRQAKYNGKHVDVTCTAKKKDNMWIIHVVAVRIIGIVAEEDIGLYPIIPSNPYGIDQLYIQDDISVIKSINDTPEQQAYINSIISEHDKKYQMIEATNKKLANLMKGSAKYNDSGIDVKNIYRV